MTKLDNFLSAYRKDYGPESVQAPGEKVITPIDSISTGSPQLDIALGVGGVPRGRLSEIFGPESSGKTTIVYHLLAEAQKAGLACAFVDAEHSADPSYAESIGVKWDELTFVQPDYGEAALEFVHRAASQGIFGLIAVDSVAALTPKVQVDGEVGDVTVGAHPRMMAQATRLIAPAAQKSDTTVIFTNQIREKIGVMFGPTETQPGGRSLKFYASVRMDIRRIETIGKGNDSTANRVRVKCVKNKVAVPLREAEFDIAFGIGIDRAAAILDMTTNEKQPGYVANLVTRAGKYFSFDSHGGAKIESRAGAIQFLRDNPEVADDLYNKIMEANR